MAHDAETRHHVNQGGVSSGHVRTLAFPQVYPPLNDTESLSGFHWKRRVSDHPPPLPQFFV